MTDGRFAVLDPAAGISGDMLLGALVSAGASADWLRALPERLGLEGVEVSVAAVDRCGVRCTKVDVLLPGNMHEMPAELVGAERETAVASHHEHEHHGHEHHEHEHHEHEQHGHDHAHSHGHEHASHAGGHAHRHIGELIELVRRAPVSAWVRERAVQAFTLLGEAEGRIHGMPAAEVSLHEVGAADAVVDIVGGIEGFEQLGLTRIHHQPPAVGRGWIHAAHGTMSVPAPATALLLEGIELAPNGPVVGEATTPTGAVLLRVLSSGAPPERWRATNGGAWGAGGRDPADYPNALRLFIGEAADEAAQVAVLATDVDDLNPEYLEPLRAALAEAGALDVQVWSTQMKKGRAGFRIEAIVPIDRERAVTAAFFAHSTTAGVRRSLQQRVTLARRELAVEAIDGSTVRVKVLDSPTGPRVKPEYEDVTSVARRTGRPAREVAEDLHLRALRLLNPLSAPPG